MTVSCHVRTPGLQLCKTWLIMWTPKRLGRVLERVSDISHRQPNASFDEECVKVLDEGMQSELRSLQKPYQNVWR